jgi:hexulose-6-phosphate isomerase
MQWKECIAAAAEAGYGGIEVNFDGLFTLDAPETLLKELKQVCDSYRIAIVSVYSRQQWKTPLSSTDPEKRNKGIQTVRRLLQIASFLEAPTVLTIPGAVDNSLLSPEIEQVPYETAYKRVQEALYELSREAEAWGVCLALENVPNKFLVSPLEFRSFIDEIKSKAVGCHFDVGNCLYYSGIPEDWIRILGTRIRALHLKDYHTASGNLSGFCTIFEGDVNWKEVCIALGEIGYEGPLISEILPPYRFHPEQLWETASRAIDALICDIKGTAIEHVLLSDSP